MRAGDKLDDKELLLRRVYRADKRYVDKSGRPSSRAFAPRPKDDGKLSVDIRRLTTYPAAVQDEQKFRLFQFEAGGAHRLGLTCRYDPVPASGDLPENLAHAIVVGFDPEDESVPGILARQAVAIGSF